MKKNQVKCVYLIVLVLIFVPFMISCNSSNQPKEQEEIHIATASTTGALYELGAELAGIWTSQLDFITADHLMTQGGIENLKLLNSGSVQVGFAISSNLYDAYHGTGDFVDDSNKELRVLAGLYYNPNQLVVRSDSDIHSMTDLAGTVFSPGALGSTTITEAEVHFHAAGMNLYQDCTLEYIGFTEAIDLMQTKALDGVWIMAGIPNIAVDKMTTDSSGRLISLSDTTIAKLTSNYPWYTKYTIPAHTYHNQDEDITTTAVKLILFTTSDLADETVYELTKTLWSNLDELKDQCNVLRSVSLEGAITDLGGLPLHPGAEKYYKEQNILK